MKYPAKFNTTTKEKIYNRDNCHCIFCNAVTNLQFHHIYYWTESIYTKDRNKPHMWVTVCMKHYLEIRSCSKWEGKRQQAIDYINNL